LPAEAMRGQGLTLIPSGRAVFTDMTVAENLQIQALALKGDQAPKLVSQTSRRTNRG
jgi:ABC-type branched-subunit amino acid transport system ATPase component